MSTPYYVGPEQVMQDKTEFARRGIEQAKEVIALEYQNGIVMVAENPLTTVFKISEIYDRIALAATGLSPEYEALRVLGIERAEIKGYTFNREDVTAKWLTTMFSQQMGAIFRQWDAKPLEVELLVCEVSEEARLNNRIYHLAFNGQFGEEQQYAVIGGRAESILKILDDGYEQDLALERAIKLAVKAFEEIEANVDENEREKYEIASDTVEVSLLDLARGRRKFRRLLHEEIREILEG